MNIETENLNTIQTLRNEVLSKEKRGRKKKIVVEGEEVKIPKKIGRPALKPEDKKVFDKAYFLNYYHNSKFSNNVNCDICKSVVTRSKLPRHMRSKYCINISKQILESEGNNENVDWNVALLI